MNQKEAHPLMEHVWLRNRRWMKWTKHIGVSWNLTCWSAPGLLVGVDREWDWCNHGVLRQSMHCNDGRYRMCPDKRWPILRHYLFLWNRSTLVGLIERKTSKRCPRALFGVFRSQGVSRTDVELPRLIGCSLDVTTLFLGRCGCEMDAAAAAAAGFTEEPLKLIARARRKWN